MKSGVAALCALLTEREITLLRAASQYGLSDHGGEYYCLGGHGCVQVRFDARTLPAMERKGLVERRGYWTITQTGKDVLTEIIQVARDRSVT